ncbi:MAG: hypothetical protein PHH11_11430 [Methylomonas sp.]|nr:hypothetical protein [Methylomonas sp.]
MLNPHERKFIEKRQRLIRYWPIVAGFLLALLVGFAAWLWFYSPYMVNPYYVIERLETGSIDAGIMQMSVLFLPTIMLFLIVVLIVVVLLGFAVFSIERQYQTILGKLLEGSNDISET